MADNGTLGMPAFVSFTSTYHNRPYPFISPQRPELSVAGKNVVIAGGGTGIGKATAIAFAQAGAKSVSILGRRLDRLQGTAKEIRSVGSRTEVVCERADFSQKSMAEAGLKAVVEKVGRIDIFVWSAGIMPQVGDVGGYTGEEFRRGLDLIVMGALNAIQALLPLAAEDAKILHISTGIAHMKPIKGLFAYAVAKLAVAKLFDYLGAENPGLHVVNIQPGVVSTELNADLGVEGQDEPELSAHFTVWLASKEARFLAGKFVWVNWDAEELMSRAKEIEKSMALRIMLEGVPM